MRIPARIRTRADAAAARARFLATPPRSPDFGKPFAQWKAARDARGRPLRQPGRILSRQGKARRAQSGRVQAAVQGRTLPWRSPAQQPETRAAREQIDREMRELRQARDRVQAPGREVREFRTQIDRGISASRATRDVRDRAQAREARWRAASAELAQRYPYPGSSRDARVARQERQQERAREGRDR